MTPSSDSVQCLGFVQTLQAKWDKQTPTTEFLIECGIIVIGMMQKTSKFHEMARRQWAKVNQATL
jgi:hypothetical protein